MKRCADSWPERRPHNKKARSNDLAFFVVSILLISPAWTRLAVILDCRVAGWMSGCACLLAFSAPGATSSQDLDLVQSQRVTPRSLPVPNPHHVVARTLARPRQIVTTIVTERHKFMPSPPFGVGRSPHNWSDREIRGAAATHCLPRKSVIGGDDSHALVERADLSSRDC